MERAHNTQAQSDLCSLGNARLATSENEGRRVATGWHLLNVAVPGRNVVPAKTGVHIL